MRQLSLTEQIVEVFAIGVHMDRKDGEKVVTLTFQSPADAAMWLRCYDKTRTDWVTRITGRPASEQRTETQQ